MHHRAQKFAIAGHHRFNLFQCPVTVLSGHGSIFSWLLFHSNRNPLATSQGRVNLDGHSRLSPPRGRATEIGQMEERLMERVVGQEMLSGARAPAFTTRIVLSAPSSCSAQ